jgi:hypothetical protein
VVRVDDALQDDNAAGKFWFSLFLVRYLVRYLVLSGGTPPLPGNNSFVFNGLRLMMACKNIHNK